MTKYVMLVTNNEGGSPATIHASLDDAKAACRAYLTDPNNHPSITPREIEWMERDLSWLTGEFAQRIQGSETWKESVYIAPLVEEELPPRSRQVSNSLERKHF